MNVIQGKGVALTQEKARWMYQKMLEIRDLKIRFMKSLHKGNYPVLFICMQAKKR